MNEVNRTLFIPLYGKAQASRKQIILKDPAAERIWEAEAFPIHGKSRSKWLAYNMAMRARVFDGWTEEMLRQNREATVLQLGCGLDGRCLRVNELKGAERAIFRMLFAKKLYRKIYRLHELEFEKDGQKQMDL